VKESKVEDFFVEQRKRGGEVRKVKWLGRAHAPDRLALLPGKHFYAELKAPGKSARAGQQREHMRMRFAGCKVYVLDTIEAIKNLFYHLDREVWP
jgi:hypothetical protein